MKKKAFISTVFALFISVLLPAAARAENPAPPAKKAIDPQKEKDIHKLLELSGSLKIGEQILDQLLPLFSRQYPNVPDAFWQDFRKEFKSDSFMELLVPVYDAHFSAADVAELIKFYESPIGRKLVKEQPLMMSESMKAGQKWGFDVGQKVAQKLKDKGYVKS